MPWDIPKTDETIAVQFKGSGTRDYGPTYRTEVEKFPLAYYEFDRTAGTLTYSIGWEYSVDNENWVYLFEVSGLDGVTDRSGIVDLSQVSAKPSGAKYFRAYFSPDGAMGGGDTVQTVELRHAWWVDDIENSSGAKVI